MISVISRKDVARNFLKSVTMATNQQWRYVHWILCNSTGLNISEFYCQKALDYYKHLSLITIYCIELFNQDLRCTGNLEIESEVSERRV